LSKTKIQGLLRRYSPLNKMRPQADMRRRRTEDKTGLFCPHLGENRGGIGFPLERLSMHRQPKGRGAGVNRRPCLDEEKKKTQNIGECLINPAEGFSSQRALAQD
jgi:hypothetical protein